MTTIVGGVVNGITDLLTGLLIPSGTTPSAPVVVPGNTVTVNTGPNSGPVGTVTDVTYKADGVTPNMVGMKLTPTSNLGVIRMWGPFISLTVNS